jgi:hypothetical protein
MVSQGSGLPSFCAGGTYARKLPRWLHQEQILNRGARLHINLSFKTIGLVFLLVLSSFKQIDFKTAAQVFGKKVQYGDTTPPVNIVRRHGDQHVTILSMCVCWMSIAIFCD